MAKKVSTQPFCFAKALTNLRDGRMPKAANGISPRLLSRRLTENKSSLRSLCSIAKQYCEMMIDLSEGRKVS